MRFDRQGLRQFGAFLIALTGAMAAFGPPAAAEDITFKIAFDNSVKIPSDMRMLGWIKMKMPGQKYERTVSFQVPTPGQIHTKTFKCSKPGILFSAELTNILYEIDDLDSEKSCSAGEMTFVFHEKRYADSLRKALAELTTNTGTFRNAELASYKDELGAALESQNIATAMTKSSELYNALLAAGAPPSRAEPYRILSLDLGQSILKTAGFLDPGTKALTFDPRQKKLVLDNKSVTSIRHFQSTNNLTADGNLNWSTMRHLGEAVRY
jgi:hypothetical protein